MALSGHYKCFCKEYNLLSDRIYTVEEQFLEHENFHDENKYDLSVILFNFSCKFTLSMKILA